MTDVFISPSLSDAPLPPRPPGRTATPSRTPPTPAATSPCATSPSWTRSRTSRRQRTRSPGWSTTDKGWTLETRYPVRNCVFLAFFKCFFFAFCDFCLTWKELLYIFAIQETLCPYQSQTNQLPSNPLFSTLLPSLSCYIRL